MSLFRTLLAAAAALAIASPVFAADATTTGPEATAPAAQTTDGMQASATTTEGKININNATAKELMKVKGLNASKARAIVNYRKKHGNFNSLDDLAKVKGLSKLNAETLKNIEDQLEI